MLTFFFIDFHGWRPISRLMILAKVQQGQNFAKAQLSHGASGDNLCGSVLLPIGWSKR
jgi:hypothetical protein